MKTRYLKYIMITGLGLMAVCFSCTNLDETVYSQLISEKFIPTENDVMSIIGPAYTQLRSVWSDWCGLYDVCEESSDVLVTPVRPNGWDDGGIYRRMHKHTWTANDYHISALWSRCYTGITNANLALYQIESGRLPISQNKENYIAELKVIRAFYYYLLMDNFGNIPIVTKYDVPKDYLPEQNTRQEVYDFVVNEITSNIDLLSEEVSSKTYGRFTIWAGYALLAKVYLNAEVYTGVSKWTECITACDKILTPTK